MNDITYVIRYCSNLITNTYLSFGQFHFSILQIMISLAAVGIIGTFIHKIFSD